MEPVIIGIIIVAVILVVGYFAVQNQNKLLAEGKIVRRDGTFYQYAEIFTLKDVDFADVWTELKNADYSGKISAEANTGSRFVKYVGATYNARLYHMDDESERNAYCFEFTQWSTHKGIPKNLIDMNILLTAVEKSFLKIDPNTQISTRKNSVKSKTKFF